MSYCSRSPDPASPMAANFTEFGAEGSATSWAVTLHHAEMTRSSVVRSRGTHLRSIGELGPEVQSLSLGGREHSIHRCLVTSSILARLSFSQFLSPWPFFAIYLATRMHF